MTPVGVATQVALAVAWANVPPKARACPDCGADEQTGWSEAASAEGLDLPDENFDYDDFVKREFGGRGPVPRGIRWYWWLIALVVVVALLALWLR